jgi:hypothetical protein
LGRKFDLEETEIPLEVQGDVDYAPTYSLDVPGLERPLSEHKKGSDISFENDTELRAVILEMDRHLSLLKNKYSSS